MFSPLRTLRPVFQVLLQFIVGKDASGTVVRMDLRDIPFSASATGGGTGLGTLSLNIPSMTMAIAGTVASGQIKISVGFASGGGTLSNSMKGSQFAFAVNLDGGQFECLMAGFSGHFQMMGMEVLQMAVHGAVTAGSLSTT